MIDCGKKIDYRWMKSRNRIIFSVLSVLRLQEGEASHVIGEVFEGDFDFGSGKTDGVNHHAAEYSFHVSEDMFHPRTNAGASFVGTFFCAT